MSILSEGLGRLAELLAKGLNRAIGRKTTAFENIAIKHLESKRLLMTSQHSYVPPEVLDKEFKDMVTSLKELNRSQ